MYQFTSKVRSRRSYRRNRNSSRRPLMSRHRRVAFEALEPRQMLAAAPLSTNGLAFQVVDDATANVAFRYDLAGAAQGSSTLAAANAAPRGVTSTAAGDRTWVVDANRNVYVYNASGGLLGSWAAGSMAGNATPEGIATDGNDVWILDSKSDKVFRYAGAASRLSGSQNAASSFTLNSGNSTPKDLVTDGAALWTVDDGKQTDKVFKYSLAGSFIGSWTIDSANKAPTALAFDPANVADLWIADSGTDRVYRYDGVANLTGAFVSASASFGLGSANKNPQGLTVKHAPFSEAPYQVEWVRQFGTGADDGTGGVSADSSGNIYLSGSTFGSLEVPNPSGLQTPIVAQYDGAGNQNWLEQADPIPGVHVQPVRVAADDLGNVFQIIVSNPGTAALNNFDPLGELQWTTPLPAGEAVFSVTTDNLGYAYMEIYEGSIVRLRKFDGATGAIVWERSFDTGGMTNSSGVWADQLGNIYVTGHTTGSLLGPNAGIYDNFVAKYDDAGNLLWTKQFGTAGYDRAGFIAADTLGNVYVSGGYYASVAAFYAEEQDIFITKLDAAGNEQWTRRLATSTNDSDPNLWADNLGNVYFTGTTRAALGGPHLGGIDRIVGKYGSAGELLMLKQIGTSGDDRGSSITGDDLGNIYMGVATTGSWGGPNAGGMDAVLLKLSPAGMAMGASAAAPSGGTTALSATTTTLASTSTSTATNPSSKSAKAMSPTSSQAQSSDLLLVAGAARRLTSDSVDSVMTDMSADELAVTTGDSLDNELLTALAGV